MIKDISELSKNWITCNLENIIINHDKNRIPVKKKNRIDMEGDYPYYGASGIIDYVDNYIFDGNYLLIGEDGANLLARTKPIAFQAKDKFWVNNHAHILQTRGEIPLSYLEYYINYIELKMFITGTAQPKLTQGLMNKIPIPIPPLNEQKLIVSKIEELFTKLDVGIKDLKQTKQKLKVYRQSLLKDAFEGKLTEKWRKVHKEELGDMSTVQKFIEQKRKKNRLKKFKDLPLIRKDELPEIPDSWINARIWEVSNNIQYGTSEKANNDPSGVPVLRMGNIQDGKFNFSNLKYMKKEWEKLDDFILNDGDVLFNRTNSAELVGKTAVYKEFHPKSVFASYLIRVKLNLDIYDPDFLGFFINSYYGRLFISSVVSQQVGQANVNGTKLSLIPIPIPPITEQKEIIKIIEEKFTNVYEIENTIINSLKQSQRLRQSILKKAFEGKLVPQDLTDEPAAKLMERIKAEIDKQKPKKRIKSHKKIIKQSRLV